MDVVESTRHIKTIQGIHRFFFLKNIKLYPLLLLWVQKKMKQASKCSPEGSEVKRHSTSTTDDSRVSLMAGDLDRAADSLLSSHSSRDKARREGASGTRRPFAAGDKGRAMAAAAATAAGSGGGCPGESPPTKAGPREGIESLPTAPAAAGEDGDEDAKAKAEGLLNEAILNSLLPSIRCDASYAIDGEYEKAVSHYLPSSLLLLTLFSTWYLH